MSGEIHHIEINVSDLKKTTAFWSWLLLQKLGYTLFQKWESGISFKLSNTYLVFVQTEDKYLNIPYHRKQSGLNHLAFHIDTNAQVDEMTIQLKKKGISILYENKHPFAGGENHYAVFFEDPNRIKVEIVSAEY